MKKIVPPFLRTPYNYDMNAAGDEDALQCLDKSRASQSSAQECDINYIVERYTVTGELPQRTMPPMQGDFTEAPTFEEALRLMNEAQRSFMQLPAKVRGRFENDPAQFVDFMSDENNRDEIRQMGFWNTEAMEAFRLRQEQVAATHKANAEAAAREAAREALDGPKAGPKKGTS